MAVYETFSKRQRRLSGNDRQDVYQYDQLPDPFRVQVIHIWNAALGPAEHNGYVSTPQNNRWRLIHDTLAKELGRFSLGASGGSPWTQCVEFLTTAPTEHALDLIELTFRVIDGHMRDRYGYEGRQDPDEAIAELNHRFREHGIGYQFVGGQLIKVDSQYVHAEVVQPAISLLYVQGFRGAEEEFLKAHEHYRHGRNKEAIVDALKAFESTMKAICDGRKWSYATTATAKDLIGTLLANGLIPTNLQTQFTALRSVLESGVPTVRNKTSGHGQGTQPIAVPDYVAAYALHSAAANIVFLVEACKANK